MLPVVAILAFGLCGWAAGRRLMGLDPERQRGPAERGFWYGVLGLAAWIGAAWVLAWTRLLGFWGCTALTAVAAGLAIVALRRDRPKLVMVRLEGPWAVGLMLLLAELVLWVVFAVWRGEWMGPSGNDAFSYHLPKAVLLLLRHGIAPIASPDLRLATWPANYELLLSYWLGLGGIDHGAVLLSAAIFVLFVLGAAACAERWWGPGLHVIATAAFCAGAPVVLLHTGLIKNDLLTSVLFLGALLALGELVVQPGRFAAVGLVVTTLLALGTKVSAALLGVSLLPALLFGGRPLIGLLRRNLRLLLGAGAVAMALGGAAIYLVNLVRTGHPVGIPAIHAGAWGDFENLISFPYMLITAPFSATVDAVWVPWAHRYWFWQKYDPYSSNFGALATVVLGLAPFGFVLWRYRPTPRSRELVIASLSAFLCAILIIPTRIRPVGFYCTFTRFLIFVLPFVAAWGLCPFLVWMGERKAGIRAGALAAVLICEGVLAREAVASAQHDLLVPISRVELCVGEDRCAPRYSGGRACFLLNRIAGSTDTVLIDSDYDAWIYPCFGAQYTRRVVFLDPGDPRAEDKLHSSDWVAVDRMQGVTWGHPGFTDFGHFFEDVGKGQPTPDERETIEALSRRPDFRRVYFNAQRNQALFRHVRIGRTPAAARGGG